MSKGGYSNNRFWTLTKWLHQIFISLISTQMLVMQPWKWGKDQWHLIQQALGTSIGPKKRFIFAKARTQDLKVPLASTLLSIICSKNKVEHIWGKILVDKVTRQLNHLLAKPTRVVYRGVVQLYRTSMSQWLVKGWPSKWNRLRMLAISGKVVFLKIGCKINLQLTNQKSG